MLTPYLNNFPPCVLAGIKYHLNAQQWKYLLRDTDMGLDQSSFCIALDFSWGPPLQLLYTGLHFLRLCDVTVL